MQELAELELLNGSRIRFYKHRGLVRIIQRNKDGSTSVILVPLGDMQMFSNMTQRANAST